MIWSSRQRRARLLLGVAAIACGLALAHPDRAHAGWPLGNGGGVVLGFGETYQSEGSTTSKTHHGIDIAAESGMRVIAPLAGSVTFAGAVPAAGGGTVRAVTIATQAGSVTLLPLANTAVAKGDAVDEGDAVGMLAANGDGSSESSHLHVGVKRGRLYVDPLSVLDVPTPGSEESGRNEGRAVAGASPPAHAPEDVSAHETLPWAGTSEGLETAGVSSRATAAQPAPQLRPALPGAGVSPGVSVAGQHAPGHAAGASVHVDRPAEPLGRGHVESRRTPGSAVSPWRGPADRLRKLLVSVVKTLVVGATLALAAIGALWPLWRREERKGSGQLRVSATGEDVAAAVGR